MTDTMTEQQRRPAVHFRLDRRLLDRLDSCAGAVGIGRPEAIRSAILKWVEAAEQTESRRRRLAKSGGEA